MSNQENGGRTDIQKLKLSEENANEFWNAAWEHDVTGWRHAEQQPFFTRNLYVFACNAPGASDVQSVPMPCVVGKEENSANLFNGPAEEKVVAAFLKGKAVLVPLCGDTPVLRYLADHGAAMVVGADLAPEGLRRQREKHFSEITFAATPLTLPSGGAATIYEGVKDGCTVRLFEGDFLALAALPEFHRSKVDFVYDRASMMAMHPSMRVEYVASVAACLTPEATLMVERPIRDAGDVGGPPFTFFPDQVHALYEAATGRSYDVETMLVNRWYGHPEPGSAHYFEFLRVCPRVSA